MRYLTLIFLLISFCAGAQTTTHIYDTVGGSVTRSKLVIKSLSEMPDSVWTKFGSVSVKVPKSSFAPQTWGSITGKPSFATVATSGSYADLSNKPTITTNTNQLTNGSGFLVAADIAGKQNTLVSATNIKTVNGSSLLGSGDISISGTAAWGSVTGTLSNQSDLQTVLNGKIGDNTDMLAYTALGSPFLAQTVGAPVQTANTSTALVDGQIKFTAVYLPKATTITGIRVYVRVLGAYTGDNNNRVGLYSYSAGVLTLVASSANNATQWTGAANAFQTIAFSSPYAAAAGIYYVGVLYNQSAQTTAPALASGVALNNVAMATLGFSNSAKLYGTANGADLTTPINMSAITASVIPTWIALY